MATKVLVEKGGEERSKRDSSALSACVTEVISKMSMVGSSEVGRGSASKRNGASPEPPD